jgi:hypothetical protein
MSSTGPFNPFCLRCNGDYLLSHLGTSHTDKFGPWGYPSCLHVHEAWLQTLTASLKEPVRSPQSTTGSLAAAKPSLGLHTLAG